jgi:translocation and assembly module TamB
VRRRAIRLLAHGLRSAGLLATFGGALVFGVTLHSKTPAFRRLANDIGNQVMRSLFDGRIEIRGVESLSIGARSEVHVREAEVTDPDGRRVILANDIEAAIDLRRLLGSLARTGVPDVELDSVRIGRAEVALDVDPNGSPRIARTFRSGGGTAPPQPSEVPPTLPLRSKPDPKVHIQSAWIGSAWVHGDLVPPGLDGDTTDLQAHLHLEDKHVTVTLERGHVTLRSPKLPNQRAPLTGAVRGDVGIALDTSRLEGSVRLEGACGEVPIVARAELHDDHVDAQVDLPRTEPAALATAFSGLPWGAPGSSFTKPVEIHAHAQGKLPTVSFTGQAHLGDSSVAASGELDVRQGKGFKLDVDASHVDAADLGAGLQTDLSAKISAEGTLGGAGALGTFRVSTSEGAVDSERIPATTIEGRFEPRQVTAVLRAREPGVEANGKLTLDLPPRVALLAGSSTGSTTPPTKNALVAPRLTFDIQARSSSLRSLARAPNVVGGTGSARAQGKVDFGTKTIQATTTVSADNVAHDAFSAGHVSANGIITGPVSAPLIDVGFDSSDMRVKAQGKAPLVYPHASGRAKIALAPTPRVLDATINLGRPGSPHGVTASAEAVHVTGGVVDARGLRITGLGEPVELDARIGKGQWSVRAKSAGVDLHRAARVTGIRELELLPEGTRATLDVDVREGRNGADGHFDIVVRSDKSLLGNGAIVAEAHGTIASGKLVGNGKVSAEGIGLVEVTQAELDIPGRLDARALQRATGVVELRGTVDLSQGAALLAGENVERVSGLASFEARIERGEAKALPAVRGTLRTQGLEVALTGEPPSQTTEIAGVDLLSHVAWDGRTDDAEISILSWDKHGVLGSAGAKAKVPLAAWLTGAKKIDARALAALDVRAVADSPARDFANLPAFFERPALRGRVDGHAEVSGLLGHPNVVVSAHARSLREDRRRMPGEATFNPLDATLDARWDGERAAITFAFDERQRRQPSRQPRPGAKALVVPVRQPRRTPGHLRGLVLVTDLRMRDMLHGKPLRDLPWAASAEVEVENLALTAIPVSTGLSGLLTGRARVKDFNRDASFEAKAHVDNFGTGGAVVQNLDLTAGGRDASLFAHASITDESTNATLQLASKSLRVKGTDLSWEPEATTRLDYVVQNGRLALLTPLLKGLVSEIDGRIDGTGSVTVDNGSQVFEGGLALQDARLYVNLLGEEISSLTATAKFDRTGVFRIEDATGKMGSGEFRASVNGQMKGLRFMGADATIVATKDGIPISSEGATFADATGELKLSAKMSEDRRTLLVDATVPRADIQLPDRTTQSLQSLDPDPTVAIGVRQRNGKLDTTAVRKSRGGTGQQSSSKAEQGLVTRVNVALGNEVHLEGRGINVNLGGRTVVELANELKVTGRIDLRSGTIEVHGRKFTVDRGTVTFPDGADPGNPTVVAAAYWDSPDRTRVWVEYAGPLNGGKLTLRSEPAYSPNEILSVLLFGRPDPNMAAAGNTAAKSNDAAGATAVGTGFIAADINRALSEIDKETDIETDTLSGNRTRTKLGRSFFDRRLKVQIGYAPGRTTYREPDTTYLFLNWQFIPKWSLVATRGDRGTSILDVLFQHRY